MKCYQNNLSFLINIKNCSNSQHYIFIIYVSLQIISTIHILAISYLFCTIYNIIKNLKFYNKSSGYSQSALPLASNLTATLHHFLNRQIKLLLKKQGTSLMRLNKNQRSTIAMPPLPKDPIILLSFTNMQLRDNYKSLTEFCKAFMIEEKYIVDKLLAIDYQYNRNTNQFI